jgi:integrin beta 2
LVCSDDMALFERCTMQCVQTQGYTCGGETFPPDRVCDGITDCADASDEVDCPPPFTCDDGYEIAPKLHCDGIPDCFDASDEDGCAEGSSTTCADGTPLPPMWRCDEKQDCADGSDEADCAMIVCPG